MRSILTLSCFFVAQALLAQPVVAPTPEQAGSPRGTNTGDYNVMDSFETGYRFAAVSGSQSTYNADVNFGNGIRLLSGSLMVSSKDGHGKWFDQISLTTIGLGNDPFESTTLRVEKNKLYRYDMVWRLDDYYNQGLPIAAGYHWMDTQRRMQDHDLTLFPQSWFKLRFGYSRNLQDGPALSSIQLFDQSNSQNGSTFPVFSNVHREQNDYRLGADVELAGFRLTVMHVWDDFKEDTGFQQEGVSMGSYPAAGVSLSQFQRTAPYHGTNPAWLGNLTRSSQKWAMNGHLTYVSGRGDYILDENAFGAIPMGAQNQQVFVAGAASRPALAGDLSVSWFPDTRLTIVNNSAVSNNRYNGNSFYEQYDNATQTGNFAAFRYLGLRRIANATDLHYRITDWLSIYAGYHYSARRIQDLEDYAYPAGTPLMVAYMGQRKNHQNEGLLGVRIKPVKAMTINLESEIGRDSQPLAPISDGKYQALGARFEYRIRKLTLNAAYKENYDGNSVSLSSYSSRARNYNVGAAWAPNPWFTLDASYAKMHLDTVAGTAFFTDLSSLTPVTPDLIYISNIHAVNVVSRFSIRKRVDIDLGYSITKDTGDGRNSAVPADVTDPVGQTLAAFQTFPLSYQSPQARVSVRLHEKLRWNAGWQYYNYHEEFGLFSFYQGYHAHTGYTSLTWAF